MLPVGSSPARNAIPAPFLIFLCIALLANGEAIAPLAAQDVENVLEKVRNLGAERLAVTGGLRFGTDFYRAAGIEPRRDNLQWNARASLNFRFFGFSAPFSFAFSDANQNFRLPAYTFAGISPTYKWITAHAGDRSLSFSRYTLDGITFRGGGIELRPGNFRFAAFYGNLNRALLSDLNAVGNLNGFYQRKGWGGKIGYEGTRGSVNLILFSAADDADTEPVTARDFRVAALENRVVSLQGRQMIGSHLTVSAEAAHSVTNQDRASPSLERSEVGLGNGMLGFFQPNQSFVAGQAFRLTGFYNLERTGVQAGYERVTRGFRTLGALFFNTDSERITAGANRSFWEGKLNLSANGGLERTNLDAAEGETTNRLIGSLQAGYRPTDDWTFSGGYSNFRNDTKLRGRTDLTNPVDSIFLAQVTQTVSGMAVRQLSDWDRPGAVSLLINHQRANNIINDEVLVDNQTRFTNLALTFSSGRAASGLQYSFGVNGNFTHLGELSTRTLSPHAGVTKALFNNSLTTQFRTALSVVRAPDDPGRDHTVVNGNLAATYRLRNSHTVSLSAIYLNRFGAENARRNFSELYGNLSYGYRFGGQLGGRGVRATE